MGYLNTNEAMKTWEDNLNTNEAMVLVRGTDNLNTSEDLGSGGVQTILIQTKP